ncbi:MAG: ribonuclease III [Spirochaetaceae bacterium]|jgi:ribonuclease-3|nr:ribonuclease III [Spirochaetaceae bacterium]
MLTNSLNPNKNNKKFILNPERKKELISFENAAGFRMKDLNLLNLAFTHRSVTNEAGNTEQSLQVNHHGINNERLEFLGDAILGATAASYLYINFPEKNEGELAKIKAVVVSEDILSGVARELQLDTMMLLGKGEESSGGRGKNAILADAMEALIGAIYIDGGFLPAFNFINSWLDKEVDRVISNNYHLDYKSLLQEYCQQKFRRVPVYKLLKSKGQEHSKLFWVEALVGGKTYGPGIGRNKKAAEQEAAKIAWVTLHPEKQQ